MSALAPRCRSNLRSPRPSHPLHPLVRRRQPLGGRKNRTRHGDQRMQRHGFLRCRAGKEQDQILGGGSCYSGRLHDDILGTVYPGQGVGNERQKVGEC